LTNKKPEAYRKLKDSIHNNKGIVYPIWVEHLMRRLQLWKKICSIGRATAF
jgi:hypothetical protein